MRRLALLGTCLFALGCQGGSEKAPPATTTPAPAPAEGSSSGGGSFGNESSRKLLLWASQDLARQIMNSSPELYRELPEGWTQKRLADIIRAVEMTKLPEVSRHGERLMFDYRKKPDGSLYITATRLFAEAYSSYEVNSRPIHTFYYALEEIKLKLAHEVAHLMGLGTSKATDLIEARIFAIRLMHALDTDNLECLTTDLAPVELFFEEEEPENDWELTRAYLINRPSGKSISPHNFRPKLCSETLITMCIDEPEEWKRGVFYPLKIDGHISDEIVLFALMGGPRVYGLERDENSPFSWKQIDPRNSVWTKNGFRSGFDYTNPQGRSHFSGFMDFQVVESSSSKYTVRVDPRFRHDSPLLRFNYGTIRLEIRMNDAHPLHGKILITRSLWPIVSNNSFEVVSGFKPLDPSVVEMHKEVPIACTRTFVPIKFPNKNEDRAARERELEDAQ